MKTKIDIGLRKLDIFDLADGEELGELDRTELETLDWLEGYGDSITENEMDVPKTPEEVDAVIAQLQKEKSEIAETSLFGDHNWLKIDRQIETLEWFKEA